MSSQAKPSEATGSQLVSLQQLSDPAYICSQKGFKASTVVYERSVGPQNLFDIKAFGECIQLEQRSTLLVKPVKASIPLETFLKEFVPFKGDLPMIIENSIVAAHLPSNNATIQGDIAKAGFLLAMCDYAKKNMKFLGFLDWHLNPSELTANADIAVNKLVISPMVSLGGISLSKSSTQFTPGTQWISMELSNTCTSRSPWLLPRRMCLETNGTQMHASMHFSGSAKQIAQRLATWCLIMSDTRTSGSQFIRTLSQLRKVKK